MMKFSAPFFLIYFFTSILGIVVAFILYFFNRNNSLLPRLLAVYLFLFSLVAFHTELFFTNFFLHFPHLWRTVGWATFLAPVVAYLYVRSVLTQAFTLQKTDFLFLIPSVIYTLCSVPWFIKSHDEKIAVITRLMNNKVAMAKEPEIYLPQNWGIAARLLYGLIFIIAQYHLLFKFKRKYKATQLVNFEQNKKIIQWLYLFTSVLAMFYIILIPQYFTVFISLTDLTTIICFSFSGTILFISLYLLAQPSILYGLTGWMQEPVKLTDTTAAIEKLEPVSIEKNGPEPVVKKITFTSEQGIAYKNALENHFSENHPYLKSGYSLNDLSTELDIRSYLLSAFINQNFGKNFNELVNDYRVNFFINLLKENPSIGDHYTLEAISKQVGFNTQKAFIAAVKKRTGKLPSEFLAEINT